MDTQNTNTNTDTNQGSNAGNATNNTAIDHKDGCSTVFQLGRFDRQCPRCSKIEKVIYLRRKTVANGCTPDEMASSCKLAQSLCDKYLLVDAEVIDRAYAPDVKKAEEAAKAQARAERETRQREAAEQARKDAEAKASEQAAREAASAKLDALRATMETAKAEYERANAEYAQARKDAGISAKSGKTRKSASQSTCSQDDATCPCRSHAAKRAWNTMRQNHNGYAFGNKVA